MIKVADHYSGVKLEKILLLEDDPGFSSVLCDFLESVPYDVVAVENGVDGLRRVMAEDFTLVLCDMMMPKLSGDMFYRAVERVKPNLCSRFIFITGHGANPKVDRFMREIRGTMLPKPFHMDMLNETIKFCLGRAR